MIHNNCKITIKTREYYLIYISFLILKGKVNIFTKFSHVSFVDIRPAVNVFDSLIRNYILIYNNNYKVIRFFMPSFE